MLPNMYKIAMSSFRVFHVSARTVANSCTEHLVTLDGVQLASLALQSLAEGNVQEVMDLVRWLTSQQSRAGSIYNFFRRLPYFSMIQKVAGSDYADPLMRDTWTL